MSNDDIQALLAEIRSATEDIRKATRADMKKREAERAENADTEAKQATGRRDGDFGRNWQILQQRIDTNRTTMDDILSGVDKSDEARAVRMQIQEDILPKLNQQFAEATGGEDLEKEVAKMKQAQAELVETLASLQSGRKSF